MTCSVASSSGVQVVTEEASAGVELLLNVEVRERVRKALSTEVGGHRTDGVAQCFLGVLALLTTSGKTIFSQGCLLTN